MQFIANQGYKSILSLLDSSDKSLITNYNRKNPDNQIEYSSINIAFWKPFKDYISLLIEQGSLQEIFSENSSIERNNKKISQDFIDLVNKLPKPIYMHCLAGEYASVNMAKVVKAAIRADKIELNNTAMSIRH